MAEKSGSSAETAEQQFQALRQSFEPAWSLLVRSAGDPKGPPILWIHGLGESGLCFEGLLEEPRLARWHHLAPDLPGYGKSPWREPLDLEGHAEHLGRWLQERGGEPAVVVGHSMGGVVGLLLAERYPERVRALFNVEGNLSLDDCGFSRRIAEQPLDAFLGGGRERLLAAVYRQGVREAPLTTYFASMSLCEPRQLHKNSRDLVEASLAKDLAARQAKLAVPHLYLHGRPRGTGAYSLSLLAAAGVAWRTVEDAGHWPFLDQPEAFLGEFLAFLEGLEGG